MGVNLCPFSKENCKNLKNSKKTGCSLFKKDSS
jgi:hypothetical protein